MSFFLNSWFSFMSVREDIPNMVILGTLAALLGLFKKGSQSEFESCKAALVQEQKHVNTYELICI